MERKLPGKFFQKVGYNSRGCPPFWKFWKMLFLSLLEVAENSNQTFWLNGKRQIINYRLFCIKKSIRIKVYVRVFLGLRTMHKWYT